jgi:hypothetical protein
MDITTEKFDQWAIVELFGHQRIAGRLTEQTIGGCSFVRIDVPAIEQAGKPTIPGFTKCFGNGAIYGISFVDETTARFTAQQLKLQPIDVWTIREAIKAGVITLPAPERVAADFEVTDDDEIPL